MQLYVEQYKKTVSFNEYFVNATIEYWRAVSFPALYLAKYL